MEVSICCSTIGLHENDLIEIVEVAVGLAGVGETRSALVNPELCVITEIGQCHMDGHGSIENLIKNKSSVVTGMIEGGSVIVNGESDYAYDVKKEVLKLKNVPIDFFGKSNICDAQLIDARFLGYSDGWEVKGRIRGKTLEYRVPLVNEFAPVVSLGVLLAVEKLGLDVVKASKDYETFVPFETMGKFHEVKLGTGLLLFYDQSRRGAIQGFRAGFADFQRVVNQIGSGRRIAVIAGSSIYNDTVWTKEQHTEIASLINSSGINFLYTIGKYMNYVHSNLNPEISLVAHGDSVRVIEDQVLADLQGGDQLIVIGHGRHHLENLSKKILKISKK